MVMSRKLLLKFFVFLKRYKICCETTLFLYHTMKKKRLNFSIKNPSLLISTLFYLMQQTYVGTTPHSLLIITSSYSQNFIDLPCFFSSLVFFGDLTSLAERKTFNLIFHKGKYFQLSNFLKDFKQYKLWMRMQVKLLPSTDKLLTDKLLKETFFLFNFFKNINGAEGDASCSNI